MHGRTLQQQLERRNRRRVSKSDECVIYIQFLSRNFRARPIHPQHLQEATELVGRSFPQMATG